ncbi:MAG: ABC transporter ATP-binding protein [Candidatus Babeliales bacterium]|nr:ABC transporter ATP-binding protein [Candidatus Babeliales bacterium]
MQSYPLMVKNLSKTFYSKKFLRSKEEFVAINDISFALKQGEVLGLLGPDGAGKTTTIQMLLGLMTPCSGDIEYFGKNFLNHKKELLKKVTFASSYIHLPGMLTVYENLNILAALYDIPYNQRHETIKKLLKTFDIWNLKDKYASLLSPGHSARVILVKAFLPNPKIVLLDEPTASLDPEIAEQVRKFILEQQEQQGTSILLASHNMPEITEICNRILILKEGKIIEDNTPEQLVKTISLARLQLIFEYGIDNVVLYLSSLNLEYKIQRNSIEIKIDEHKIPALLSGLTKAGFEYVGISIEKPTLKDYFLNVVKKDKII